MTQADCSYGIIGLGRMGGNLARHGLEKGHHVVGFDFKPADQDLLDAGLDYIASWQAFKTKLETPRMILIYVPAGEPTEETINNLATILEAGDIIVDGGNSYWGDSIRRAERLKDKKIDFIDLGTSGGINGARTGACFMAGGDSRAVALLEPVLLDLATEGGYVHAGGPGAGHYTKLVHNGIEFGMLQAIGEGMNLLEHYPQETLPIPEIMECWRHGSVIRSWLVDLLAEALKQETAIEQVPSYVEDTGEVNWLVDDALTMEVPIPIISQSIMELFTTRDVRQDWARAIAMMRKGFGGHAYGPVPAVREERQSGRLGGFYRTAFPSGRG